MKSKLFTILAAAFFATVAQASHVIYPNSEQFELRCEFSDGIIWVKESAPELIAFQLKDPAMNQIIGVNITKKETLRCPGCANYEFEAGHPLDPTFLAKVRVELTGELVPDGTGTGLVIGNRKMTMLYDEEVDASGAHVRWNESESAPCESNEVY